jgi:putative thiamine transport system ATP-binding protein
MTGLVLQDLQILLNGQTIVKVSAQIAPGAVLTVMGPSGAGKSSLLGALIGTLPAQFVVSGHATLNGRAILGLATQMRKIGILFQDDLLFPHMSVAQNLGFGMSADQGLSAKARAQKIDEALASAGLDGFGARDPATLSGGQRARVALLRTVLSQPQALLLDEPFSRLDTSLRAQIRSFVFEQAQLRQLPVIMVTHDMADAVAAAGQVITPLGVKVNRA